MKISSGEEASSLALKLTTLKIFLHYNVIWINENLYFNNPSNQCAVVSVVDNTTTDADTSSLEVHFSVDIIEEIEMCCLEKIFD